MPENPIWESRIMGHLDIEIDLKLSQYGSYLQVVTLI